MKKQLEVKGLFGLIKKLIQSSRNEVALTVNSTITLLYWQIGSVINKAILNHNRADYGTRMVQMLADKLTAEFGKGWSLQQLRHCIRFAEVFTDEEIVYALRIQLSWTHLRTLIFIKDPLKREFYLELCKSEKWSSRRLQERINSMLYERTAISKRSDIIIKNELGKLNKSDEISSDLVFRDPYILNFLGLRDTFSEKDLESAILSELQHFITELGNDFAFLSRQKLISIDSRDYRIDLLFFHRRLKCLIAIDLKLGEFEASYKGQMELYLNYLEKYERFEGENAPIGLILCSGKNEEHIELMQLERSNIKIAEYITELPNKRVLKRKLQLAVKIAKNRLNNRSSGNEEGGD